MNFAATSRHGSLLLPLRAGAKSPPTESYASSCLTIQPRRATHQPLPARRIIPTSTSGRPNPSFGRADVAGTASACSQYASPLPTPNKWFRQPKIPVRLNSSTLIRMKSKNPSMTTNEVIGGDPRTNGQLAFAAISFLKRDQRRMSDHELSKGGSSSSSSASPFGDGSFVKSVFLNIVSRSCSDNVATAAAATSGANGDGLRTSATYHQISAVRLVDTGCQLSARACSLKFVERVSYEEETAAAAPQQHSISATSVAAAVAKRPVAAGQHELAKSALRDNDVSLQRALNSLNAMLRQVTLADSSRPQNDGDAISGGGDVDDDESDDTGADAVRPRLLLTKKKKLNRKHRRAVVVTSLKNSSVKFVRKTGS